jgi:hypothetical protein
VALRVIASDKEHQVITTDPEEILSQKKQANAERELRRQRLEQSSSTEAQKEKVGSFDKPNKIPWQGEKLDFTKDVLENAKQKAENKLKQNPVLPQIKNIFDGENYKQQKPQNTNIENQNKNSDQAENTRAEESNNKQHFAYSIDDYQAPK